MCICLRVSVQAGFLTKRQCTIGCRLIDRGVCVCVCVCMCVCVCVCVNVYTCVCVCMNQSVVSRRETRHVLHTPSAVVSSVGDVTGLRDSW